MRRRRVTPGDGRALPPFRWWHLLRGRHLFFFTIDRADGSHGRYALDVRTSGKEAGDEGMAYVYLDERQCAKSALPAAIPIEGGVLEAAYGIAGLKRARYLAADGRSRALVPDPGSAVGRRLEFARVHPRASTVVGAISIVLLIGGVGANVLQFVEPVLQIPPIVERFGRFESPIQLPVWLSITLAIAAGIGASERALRLRYHWLLDGVGI